MPLTDQIRPISGTHSIKEVVASVILATPIIKPERFKKLIDLNLKDKFHQFEVAERWGGEASIQDGKFQVTSPELEENVGFRFLSYEGGERKSILAGINEEKRSYIAYHAFSYQDWKSFYNEYTYCLEALNEQHSSELFIRAFNLQYVDQFQWVDKKNQIDANVLFNNGCKYLPTMFFESKMIDYKMVANNEEDGVAFLDRLEIKIVSKFNPIIQITHSYVQPLTETSDFKKLVDEGNFKKSMDFAHNHNKSILSDILTVPAKQMICL